MKKDKSLKHFIIFINSYNDFDNILPFIDYVLLNKKAKVTLYKTNDSDLNGCKDHLYYLEHAYNLIPSYYDENFSKYYNFSVILYRKYRNFARRAKHSSMLIPTLFILPWFKTLISFFTKIQVTKNKKNLTADIILFDFGKELGFYGSNIGNFQSPRDNSTLRWTVDELKDFIFINEIYSTLYVKNPEFDTQDILDLLKLKPSLIKINQDILRNEGMIKSLKKDKRFLDFLS